VPALEALERAEGTHLSRVVTNPPRPAGRGARVTPTAVATAARRLGVPLTQTDGVRGGDGLRVLMELRPDLLVVVAYGELLTAEVLDLPRLGCLNVHLSLRPRWRGASPVQRAILAGDPVTGVSIMRMDEGLDTGPIVASVQASIAPDEDAGELGERLARIGGAVVVEVATRLADGPLEDRPQDEAQAVYAAKIGREERVIDWTASSVAIDRLVRALAPTPGATTTFRGRPLKILRARPRDVSAPPGRILASEDGPVIGTGSGGIELVELAPSGRKRMPGADWARGARPDPDERLG
jgi:methionyl-tRNA formyltransferase